MNKLALRMISKMLNAISASIEEFRYESIAEVRTALGKVNKLLLEARQIITALLEGDVTS